MVGQHVVLVKCVYHFIAIFINQPEMLIKNKINEITINTVTSAIPNTERSIENDAAMNIMAPHVRIFHR